MEVILVVRIVEDGVEMDVVDLGDRGNVASDGHLDLDVILALDAEQVTDLERFFAIVDEQLAVAAHRALIDAEHAELADEGIVDDLEHEIGRASCRERVCQYVEISWVAVPLKKQKKTKQ